MSERKHPSKDLKLEEMKPERHWLGFDVFVWSAIQPTYTFVSQDKRLPYNSLPNSNILVELETYRKYHNSW